MGMNYIVDKEDLVALRSKREIVQTILDHDTREEDRKYHQLALDTINKRIEILEKAEKKGE